MILTAELSRPSLLSVIIPSYNCGALVARAVHSAYALDAGAAEVILVDDGSTDDTPARCAALQQQYPSLKVIRRANGGLSAARNTGIEAATCTFILLLDADDALIFFDTTELRSFGGDMLRIGVEEIAMDGAVILRQELTPAMTGAEFLQQHLLSSSLYIPSCAYIYRRGFLAERRLRFSPGLLHEDMLFTVQALLAAQQVAATKTLVYRYIRREGSITQQSSDASRRRRVRSMVRIAEELTPLTNDHPEVDLWRWTSDAIDYGWNSGQVGDSRRLAWALLVAECRFFLKYQHWGIYRTRSDVRWRLRVALMRFLLLRDPRKADRPAQRSA